MRGGYRPGAGRRKMTEGERQAIDKIREHLPELVEVLMDRARGHRYEDAMGRVYTAAPDVRAAIYLIDRGLGKLREEAPGATIDVNALIEALRGNGRRSEDA